MLITKARPQLDTLVRQLRSWDTALPKRAERFHAIRVELARDIRGAVPSWALWISDEVVERHRERVDRLGQIVDPLAQLIRDSESLGSEVRRLEESPASPDAELASWLRARCRDWLALLSRLGSHCEREADVTADRALYERAETTVRLHNEALLHLSEAERVRATLGSDVRGAVLAGMLPQLRKRLFTDGASPAWIVDVQELIQPLRVVVDRIQDPPRELNEVGTILTELRGWSALLTGDEEISRGIEDLELRRFRIADWEQHEVDELVEDSRRLRTSVLERVEQLRITKQREIEQGLRDLRQACGDQPELETRLLELSSRQSNRPQLFRDWLAHFEKFRHSFKNVAQYNIGTLEARLIEMRQRLAERVQELEHRPLSDEIRKDAVLAAEDLDDVRESADVEEILAQLRKVNEIGQQVEALEQRAQRDLEIVEQQEKSLIATYDALTAELARVKRVAVDLAPIDAQVSVLRDHHEARNLEEHRRQAAALASALDAAQARFVERCRAKLSEHLVGIQRAFEVLHRAGARPPIAEPPDISAEATPHESANAVLEARRIQNVLLRLARATRDQLDARRERAMHDLQGIEPDDLGPADRQRAGELTRELEESAASRDRNVISAVESMAEVLEDCDRFFDMLQQEQRSARERLVELHRHFREFTEDQLAHHCPQLSERVAGLLYGIPEHPRHWRAVHQQLDRAAELFGRVRRQAQRLAADELHRAAETLRANVRGGSDLSFRNHAQQLLADLDAFGTDRLPPAALRQRLLYAAQRRI